MRILIFSEFETESRRKIMTKERFIHCAWLVISCLIFIIIAGCSDRSASGYQNIIDLGEPSDFFLKKSVDTIDRLGEPTRCKDDRDCQANWVCEFPFSSDDEGICLPEAPCSVDTDCGPQAFCRFRDGTCRPPGRCFPIGIPYTLVGQETCDCYGHQHGETPSAVASIHGVSTAWFGHCDSSDMPCRLPENPDIPDLVKGSVASELILAVAYASSCRDDAECWPVVDLGGCHRVAISVNASPGEIEHLRRAYQAFTTRCGCDDLEKDLFPNPDSPPEWPNHPKGRCIDHACQ